ARLHVNGNAPPVVANLDRPVGHQCHLDAVTSTRQGLVDRVVDDLPHTVHEPARVGRPDVHPWALADRLQTFEDLQVAGHVARGARIRWASARDAPRPPTAGCTGGGGHGRPFGATEEPTTGADHGTLSQAIFLR